MVELAGDFDEAYVEIECSSPFLPYIGGEAARLELCALAAKRALGIAQTAVLDPWQAAEKIGLEVRSERYLRQFPEDVRQQLLVRGCTHWSAATLVTDDGEALCILLNPKHDVRRQRVTLAEELAHVVMGHPPCEIDPRTGIRTYSDTVEGEAFGVGGAMVLPYARLFSLAKTGVSEARIAEQFGVSERFVRYRINRAGLRPMYRRRAPRAASSQGARTMDRRG
jgi:hypothetical protein